MLATLLLVGLGAIILTVWTILTHRSSSIPGNTSRVNEHLVHMAQTHEAQQHEITRLQGELAQVQGQLATAEALLAQPMPTASFSTAGTVLDRPPLALILDAPVYKQQHNLSCESSAAAMAANFFGVQVSEAEILAALPRNENPNYGFRGNVDGQYGGIIDYGVYAEPMRQVMAQLGLSVTPLEGGVQEIRHHIRQGKLLLAWVTYDLEIQTPKRVTLSDGQTVTLVPYQHVVLVTGYNRNGLWINDPYTGTAKFYPDAEFARSFAYLNNMALVVGPPQ